MPSFRWICPAILAFLAAQASATTPQQAQTLPVADLARLVLGEAGALVVDVDRPKWSTCDIEMGCLPLTEEQLKQAPPLQSLTFYMRPGLGWSSDTWRGLCGVSVIGVGFEGGKVAGIGIRYRWASPRGMERATSDLTLAEITAEDEKCRSAGDPRTFFEGDDVVGLTAFRVAVAARLTSEAAERDAPLPFKFKCKSDFGDCDKGAAKFVAETFQPANISRAQQVDCAAREREISSVGDGACYDVELKQLGEHVFLEVADAFSDIRIKRLEYSRGMVIID